MFLSVYDIILRMKEYLYLPRIFRCTTFVRNFFFRNFLILKNFRKTEILSIFSRIFHYSWKFWHLYFSSSFYLYITVNISRTQLFKKRWFQVFLYWTRSQPVSGQSSKEYALSGFARSHPNSRCTDQS